MHNKLFNSDCRITRSRSGDRIILSHIYELMFWSLFLAGVQKAMALPPGLSVFTVSEAALARAESITDRGYYFDFLEFEKNHGKNNTPSAPAIALLYALDSMVSSIMEEGLEHRLE